MTGALCGTCRNVRLALRWCVCSTWRRKHRFVVWDGGDYYGESGICLRCGEEYSGDEWVERPMERGWRKRNLARARRLLGESRKPRFAEGKCHEQQADDGSRASHLD